MEIVRGLDVFAGVMHFMPIVSQPTEIYTTVCKYIYRYAVGRPPFVRSSVGANGMGNGKVVQLMGSRFENIRPKITCLE